MRTFPKSFYEATITWTPKPDKHITKKTTDQYFCDYRYRNP